MKKFVILFAIFLSVIAVILFNKKSEVHMPVSAKEPNLVSIIEDTFNQKLPLDSLEIINSDDGILIKGIANKDKIKAFLAPEVYENIKFIFLALPNQFDIELFLEISSDLDYFDIIIKRIKIDKFEIDTNIILKN